MKLDPVFTILYSLTCSSSSGVKSFLMLNVLRISSGVFPNKKKKPDLQLLISNTTNAFHVNSIFSLQLNYSDNSLNGAFSERYSNAKKYIYIMLPGEKKKSFLVVLDKT